MSFPDRPTTGQRYVAENGQEYIWTSKGTWRSLNANGVRPKQIPYTVGPDAPVAPGLGDQWFDTTTRQLKTWAFNGVFNFWRVVVLATEFDDPSTITLVAERTLPLVWNYSEANYAFEAWSGDRRYNWRDGEAARITRITAQDDTIELESTSDLVQGKRYVVVGAAGNTLAVVDILSVLSPTVARARTTFGISVSAADGATLARTSFDVRAGYALVGDGDRYYSRPLRVLQNNFKGRLRIRRSAEGRGGFTVGVRTPGTDAFEPVPILETTTPGAGFRDEIYAVDRTGPVEFSLLFTDSTGAGDRVEHLMLYPAPQAVDQRRVEQPTNFAPADQAINVSTTPTLQGSAFRSLYNLPQNGAEFQIAANEQFTNLIVNSSSDFLASWVAVTGATITGDVRALDYVDTTTVMFVGAGGYARRSLDGGVSRAPVTLAGAPTTDLQSVSASGTTVVLAGDSAVLQYSVDSGATFTAVTPAGGYSGAWQGVALADKYGVVVGAAGEIQRTVNNAGGIYAKAPADNGYTGTWYDATLLPNGRGIVVGEGGEIQTTSDYGATWRKRTQAANYTGTWFGITLDPSGRAVAVGAGGEIQTSDDYGATWARRNADGGYTGAFNHVKLYGAQAVAVGAGGEIQTSANYGLTWSKRTTPGANTADLTSAAFSALGDYALLVGNGVAYRPLKLDGAVTTYTVPSGVLGVSAVYYWRARYQDSAGFWSEYSKPTVFATKATLNAVMAPTNLAPAREATNISVVPLFQASPFLVVGDNDTHNGSQWQISKGAVFGAITHDSGIVASDTTTYTLPSTARLDDRTVYSWRVRYRGATNGWGEWSVPTSFECTAKSTTPRITNVEENSARAVLLTVTPFASVLPGDKHSVTYYEIANSPTFGAASLIRSGTVVYTNTANLTLPQTADVTGTARALVPDTQYYFRVAHKGVVSERSDWSPVAAYRTSKLPAIGEAVFTTPGVYDFVVPADVTSLCAVVVGGGGGSATSQRPANDIIEGSGGGGGGLTWKNNIPVTPGQRIQITVGAGGQAGDAPAYGSSPASKEAAWGKTKGGTSSVGAIISAEGGRCWNPINEPEWNIGTGGRGGVALGGDGGGNGGRNGTWPAGVVYRHQYTAGGGAGGYTGDGGSAGGMPNGEATLATDGAGGGGGGASRGIDGRTDSNGGGGVGLYGQGANGAAGRTIGDSMGRGGSGGTDGQRNTGGGAGRGGLSGPGGVYGGGTGHATDNYAILVRNGVTIYPIQPAAGANGAVRLMWGPGRSFPLNAK